MTIELHIDHLVLDGFDGAAGDPRALSAALRAELARLLASTPAATWRPARATVLRGPEVTVTGPAATGRDLADAVYRAVRDGR
ncbi:hypothetical protein PUR71_08585 [Streptomyces sp. SP17BM10]|uniref:hypothetical protein n=1 Tax=Streptomyces sp. SP17BM10 TaxID=3002530 RepID=UPI002E774D86|nr:hypothetical protein [Streptomyces sp. SP17BM10]MEE1782971.1 hypothetical protein [Streptomyces sp. SP17BM10]